MQQSAKPIITGIQQIGVGNQHVHHAWIWAKKIGSDLKLFDSADEAPLMTRYTGGQVHKRHAIFALNLQGGGGLELWQFTSRTPSQAIQPVRMGDIGIFMAKLKCKDIDQAKMYLLSNGIQIVSDQTIDPAGKRYLVIQDPFSNYYQVVEGGEWFLDYKHPMGGVCGAVIGVSNMDQSLVFYRELLGYDITVYDSTQEFQDFSSCFNTHGQRFRRVLLKKSIKQTGNFSELVDSGQIELVQALDQKHVKIFQDRFWGDLGFIHLCFDVQHMDALRLQADALGYPFTIDSQSSFDMNEASGRFSYVEDPDGTLIEFVEAFKIPILKKWGWYLNLEHRSSQKPLSRLLFRIMGLTR